LPRAPRSWVSPWAEDLQASVRPPRANQPVLDRTTGRIEITSQNHGFAVDPDSLPKGAEITHVNLNDHTVEGLAHSELRAFSVQYHPEASPGPHDSRYLFERFTRLMAGHAAS
jgi:carbamoyl-phosphate synthase small subunit